MTLFWMLRRDIWQKDDSEVFTTSVFVVVMKEAVKTSETSVYSRLHGSTSQKTSHLRTRRRDNLKS
jgi:hypothetical protein